MELKVDAKLSTFGVFVKWAGVLGGSDGRLQLNMISSMSKNEILEFVTGKGGIRYVNQSRLNFISLFMRPICTLKRCSELPCKFSSFRLYIRSMPSGSWLNLLLAMLRTSSLCSSLVDSVSYFNLLSASLRIYKESYSWPISAGIISSLLQSRLIWLSYWHSPMRPERYLIWFLAASNLFKLFSCMKMRPSNSTILQLLISRVVTWQKMLASCNTSLGTYWQFFLSIFSLTSPLAWFSNILISEHMSLCWISPSPYVSLFSLLLRPKASLPAAPSDFYLLRACFWPVFSTVFFDRTNSSSRLLTSCDSSILMPSKVLSAASTMPRIFL